MNRMRAPIANILGTCLLLLVAITAMPSSGSAAQSPAPVWKIDQASIPTTLELGSSASHYFSARESSPKLRLFAYNVGGAPFSTATVTDLLPEGLEATPGIEPTWYAENPNSVEAIEQNKEEVNRSGPCVVAGQKVTCEVPFGVLPAYAVQVFIPLNVNVAAASTLVNQVTVEGAGGQPVTLQTPVSVGEPDSEFGFPPAGEEGVAGGAFDQAGQSPEAGTHPFIVDVTSKVKTKIFAAGTNYTEPRPVEALRSLQVSLPKGMVVNPLATPVRCARADFEVSEENCPAASQVGIIHYDLLGSPLEGQATPIYNLVPEPNVPAELGFGVTGATVTIRGGLSGDFRLTAGSAEILARYAIDGVNAQLWGIPSDPRHDNARRSILPSEHCRVGCGTRADVAPFLTMPSACQSSMNLDVNAYSWLGSRAVRGEIFRTAEGEGESVEGCGKLGFAPSAVVQPTVSVTNSPTGLAFNLKVPQSEALSGSAASTVKKVVVSLPTGMSVNPPAADGLQGCSLSQVGLGNTSPATCPDASRVGSAEISTPLLEAPLKGSIYLAEQRNNPFGTLLALYVEVEGDGIVIKLPGRVDVDPQTGQVSASFDDNPQLPFSDLNVEFNSGPRAALVTPAKCGQYNIRTELTPWSSSTPVVIASPFEVTQGCSGGGFAPRVSAGTSSPVAGRYSPFTLSVTREDGEQNLSRVSATLPQGLLAKLSGVPLCPDAQAGSGDCPNASQVGATVTGVGAGPLPLYLPQAGKAATAVYLAGPYRSAPYSLVIKVPAEAGPFNLGTVSVRVALNVDPFTAQVTAESDPLPQVLEGIPVAYRDVRVAISRPEFVLNPTSCNPMQIESRLVSSSGSVASSSSRFQVSGCSGLTFKPTLKLTLKGSTKRTGHPGLKAVVTYPKSGEFANIQKAQVNLPHSEFLDQANLNKTCTRPVLLAGACPKTSVYGKVRAWTPLLERPLEGPVYLVGGFGYKLPALVAELGGQLRVLLKGKVDTGPNKGIRNTFEAVPDAPVSRFVLELKGGKKYSLLENSENLCKSPQRAIARFTGQNGAVHQLTPLIANGCKKK